MILNDYNIETYNKIVALFTRENRVGLVQATGSGKGCIAVKFILDNKNSKFLVLGPNESSLFTYVSHLGKTSRVKFMDYAMLYKLSLKEVYKLLENIDYIIFDEMHRTGATEWQKGVVNALYVSDRKSIKCLSLTATPIRFGDGCRDMNSELNFKVINGLSLTDIFEKGLCGRINYHSLSYNCLDDINEISKKLNFTNLSKEEKENLLSEIINTSKVNDDITVPKILKNAFVDTDRPQKIICYLDSINATNRKVPLLEKVFEGKKVNYYVITGKTSKEDREFILKTINDATEGIHILKAINVINEGPHINGLSGLIFLRKTWSPLIFLQQFGRAISVGNFDTVDIFDLVSNLEEIERYRNILVDYCKDNSINFCPIAVKNNMELNKVVRIIYNKQPIIEMLNKLNELSASSLKLSEEELNRLKLLYEIQGAECFELFPTKPVGLLKEAIKRLFPNKYTDCDEAYLRSVREYCPYFGKNYINNMKIDAKTKKLLERYAIDNGYMRGMPIPSHLRHKIIEGVEKFGILDAHKNVKELHPVVVAFELSKTYKQYPVKRLQKSGVKWYE